MKNSSPAPQTRLQKTRRNHNPCNSVVIAAMVLVAVAGCLVVEAQNLVANGDFDSNGDDWTGVNSTISLLYRADIGSPTSGVGALEVRMEFWNGAAAGATQFVPVSGGGSYDVSCSYFVPSADNPIDIPVVIVSWFDASSDVIEFDFIYPASQVWDEWGSISGTTTAPEGAVTVRVMLAANSHNLTDETRPNVVVFDDVVFLESGGTSSGRTESVFVPAAASAEGLAGTRWSTRLSITNRSDVSLEVSGSFLTGNSDNSGAVSSPTRLGTIPAKGALVIEDAVAFLGGNEASGGIFVLAESIEDTQAPRLVAVSSVTSTPNPSGGGSYGQGIDGMVAGIRTEGVITGVRHGQTHRSNFGAVNLSPVEIRFGIIVRRKSGGSLAPEVNWTLQPYEQRQVNLSSLGVDEAEEGAVFVRNFSGEEVQFLAYVSVVDNESGDAVFLAAQGEE